MRAKTIFVVLLIFAFSMIWNLPFDSIGIKLFYRDRVLVESLLTSKSRAESLEAETTVSKITESLKVLESSQKGESLVRYLRESGILVRFGNPQTRGAAAVFIPGTSLAHTGEIFEFSPENDYALWISQIEKGKALRSIKHDYKRLGIDTT